MAPRSLSRERTYSNIEDNMPCEVETDHTTKDQVTEAIGSYGKWQLIKSVMIISVIWWPGTFHLLNMVFFRLAILYIRKKYKKRKLEILKEFCSKATGSNVLDVLILK